MKLQDLSLADLFALWYYIKTQEPRDDSVYNFERNPDSINYAVSFELSNRLEKIFDENCKK